MEYARASYDLVYAAFSSCSCVLAEVFVVEDG